MKEFLISFICFNLKKNELHPWMQFACILRDCQRDNMYASQIISDSSLETD